MSDTLVIIIFSVGAVGLFVLGMSLTLICKGHNIKSEIGDNEQLKARGIKCAVSEAREGITAGRQTKTACLTGSRPADKTASDTLHCGDNSCLSCVNTPENHTCPESTNFQKNRGH